ncbi:MAG TPA: farnesyl diphosphate synthase [Limnochordales bacterium]|nr:farnesyl diphosphate synthase [Limnochordales bacterium]
MRVAAYLEQWAARVEAALDELLPPVHQPPPVIHESMRYSALGGGKRLRGVLAVTACKAAGGEPQQALPLAAALEMIHAYSLVHDDLPCMDDDDLRRGKPTNHKVFGEAIAVLAGDALLTHAFWVLGRLPQLAGITPATALAIIEEVAAAAGTAGLIGGQVADLEAEGRAGQVSGEELRSIHARKTGALFRASVRAGALLGGATEPVLAALTRYSEELGLAFQITDDILDVVGDPAAMGKAAGRDQARAKATYPAVYGLERARRMAAEAIDRACAAVEPLGDAGAVLVDLVRWLGTRDR